MGEKKKVQTPQKNKTKNKNNKTNKTLNGYQNNVQITKEMQKDREWKGDVGESLS